ncbi:hypothetical protein CP97_14681 [Aurantiacibacter atlanticus]|uniref:Uncharacterized protein n=1 Tax=Aurantiacibacter atlanticus TaxID=1648404 RepID=A0A168M0T6_9SPHN|nr:hypothetical protein CP97_14681 [Aurantiacibacter atlanticus]
MGRKLVTGADRRHSCLSPTQRKTATVRFGNMHHQRRSGGAYQTAIT